MEKEEKGRERQRKRKETPGKISQNSPAQKRERIVHHDTSSYHKAPASGNRGFVIKKEGVPFDTLRFQRGRGGLLFFPRGDFEHAFPVVDFNFSETSQDGLPKEQGSILTLHDGGLDVVQGEIAELDAAKIDYRALDDAAVGSNVVLAIANVKGSKVAVFQHECGFDGRHGDIGCSCVKDEMEGQAVDFALHFAHSVLRGEGDFQDFI